MYTGKGNLTRHLQGPIFLNSPEDLNFLSFLNIISYKLSYPSELKER